MRSSLAVCFALCVSSLFAQSTAAFVVVNAASYNSTVAPEALATIFGSNLALATAAATLDADGHLPTQLASTSVEINGTLASLFYVSPTQINLVIPAGLSPGTATVVIRTAASSATKTAGALLAISAPGVFTNDGSGTGAGAILNAVTAKAAPFQVQTPENGTDTRTRLAVYGTGVRNAASVTAQAQDPAGNIYPLTVEYGAAAPGFFGLDQINVVLPPELDIAGTVSLTVSADRSTANVVTIQLSQIPSSSLHVATLSVSPAFVTAGDPANLTVGLTGTARAGGYVVGLRGDSIAQVTPQLTIPAGAASANTNVTTSTLAGNATITAQAGGVTLNTSLEVDAATAAQLSSVAVALATVLGGKPVTGTVRLAATAPAGGVTVALASDNAAAVVPASITIPFGQISGAFTITTAAVTAPLTANLTATLNRATSSTKLSLLPPILLTLDAGSTVGGSTLNGTVTLGDPAPAGGATLAITSSDNGAAHVGTAVVPAGQNTVSFAIATSVVTSIHAVTIAVTYGQLTQTATLSVTPPLVPTLSGLTISPSTVAAGGTATGTVTLTSAATTATTVSLGTSAPTIAMATSNLLSVAQGQTTATFNIKTVAPGTATITATLNGVKQTATLTVK